MDIPLTKEFRMDIARLEIPVSGWTCLRTRENASVIVVMIWRRSEMRSSMCNECDAQLRAMKDIPL